MTYLDYLEQKVLLERLVIGLEEPVLIKGLGELSAKIDSGNGGYNVIHGTDFHQQGDELMFTTHDSFGHDKKIQAKVIDTIEVNMGGGNIESRPVIELDIKFAGEDYKKIPFSVSDRSTNSNPILISKGFVENELEALIDVGAMNISNEGIDVVYGESVTKKDVLNGAGTVAKAGWNAGKSLSKGLWGGLKTLGKGVMNADKWLKGDTSLLSPVKGAASMVGDVVKGAVGALGALGGSAMLEKITQFAKNIGNHDKFLETDREKVMQSLSSCAYIKKMANDKQIDTDRTILQAMASGKFNEWKVLHVCNYLCEKSDKKEDIKGLEQRRKDYKKLIKKAKEAVQELKTNRDSSQQNQNTDNQSEQIGESFALLEALILLEQDATSDAGTTGTSAGTEAGTTGTGTGAGTTGTGASAGTEADTTGKNTGQDGTDYQQITTSLQELDSFTLWFIPFGKQYDTEDQIAFNTKDYMSDFFCKDDEILRMMFNLGPVHPDSTRKVIKKIAEQLNNKTKELETSNEYQGFFALVRGDQREVSFYESLDCTSYVRSQESIQSEEAAKKKEELKQAIAKKINEVGDLNKEFNIEESDVNVPDHSAYSDVFSAIQANNNNVFKQSLNAFNDARRYGYVRGYQDETARNQYVKKLNAALKKEYPMYLLQQSDLGKQILPLLGSDYTWNGFDDLVSKCLGNKEIVNLLIPKKQDTDGTDGHDTDGTDEQDEEDPWITSKLNYFKSKGII